MIECLTSRSGIFTDVLLGKTHGLCLTFVAVVTWPGRDLYLVTPAVTQYICTTVSSKTSKRYLQYFLWLKIRIFYDKHRDFSKSMRRLPWYLQGYQFEYNFLLKFCPLPNLIYNPRDLCSPSWVLCVNTLYGSIFLCNSTLR